MIEIRSGNLSDIKEIINLVKELAIFEKEPNAVTASYEHYKEHFKKGLFKFNVASSDDKIVGMALYYETFSTWKGKMTYLEDFILTNKYRNRGIGQLLFDSVIEDAIDNGSKILKWQVLDWNEGALRFYKKNNAIIEDEWLNGKIIF